MHDESADIPRVPIRPFRCLSEASQLIAGRYWLFVGLCAVAYLFGSLVPMGILLGPMMCGLSMCYFRRLRGGEASFELLFKGFDDFVESLIATLVIVAAMMVIFIPLYVMWLVFLVSFGFFRGAGFGNAPQPFGGADVLTFLGMIGLVYLVILILLLIVGTLTAFVYPLIVDRRMKAIPALTTSLKAVLANFRGMLGLTLLNSVLGGLAAVCCYLPIFLILPLTFGANIVAYRRVFPEEAQPAA